MKTHLLPQSGEILQVPGARKGPDGPLGPKQSLQDFSLEDNPNVIKDKESSQR